ncbi:MAG TPA: ABC transporter substrate-binding protein [Acetobacteraceae bacterium]|nr:ABC transporter substrate-binding protein [Acetobacteraceae bacterium]
MRLHRIGALAAAFVLGAFPAMAAPSGPHYGGTIRLVAAAAEGTMDPQVNYTLKYWQLFPFLYDGLVTFKKAGGTDAFTIVPDLAESIPTPADGGKTYVFTLRKGIKFSNGQTLTADDVRATFVRLFKVLNPNAGAWYNVIEGGDACVKTPASCTLPGVVADDAAGTVTFHLVQPDSEFLDQLAVPFGSIVPASTPAKDMGTTPIPGTGAYMIKSYDPNRGIVMVRNPYFKQWSADAQPWGYVDEIDYNFGLTPDAQVTAIENGQDDWMFDNIPVDRLNEVATRYTKQLHLNPLLAYFYLTLNVNLAPFSNEDARLAVAYAINRADLVKLYGGPALATPSCQVLPPGMPGYAPYCPYTMNPGSKWSAPDMAKAKALMAKSGTAGQAVTIITQTIDPYRAIGVYLQSVLNELGYKASVKAISPDIEFTYLQNTKNKVQIGVTDWYQDYPAPSDFLNVLYSCANFHPGSDTSINMPGFCDKSIDAEMQKAMTLSLTDAAGANKIWAQVDRMVTDQSPTVTMFNPKHADFVSKRVGNFVFSGQVYFQPELAWVK